MNCLRVCITFLLCASCGGGDGTGDGVVDASPAADGGGAIDAGADARIGMRRVFITSLRYSGDLASEGGAATGLAGADAICAVHAGAANLGGSFRAWISDGTTSAIDRMADVGPWVDTNGVLVFNNRANLMTSPLSVIDFDENGDAYGGDAAWTGTLQGGQASTNHCGSWASTAGDGLIGHSESAADDWTEWQIFSCTTEFPLYCFEQ